MTTKANPAVALRKSKVAPRIAILDARVMP